jgi:hypothetical protein
MTWSPYVLMEFNGGRMACKLKEDRERVCVLPDGLGESFRSLSRSVM